MEKLLAKIKANWEIALFWAMLLALLTTMGIWFTADGSTGDSFGKGSAPPRQSLISEKALAFLEPTELPDLSENPFSFRYQIEQRRPWRRPERAAEPAKEDSTKPPATTKTDTPTTPPPTPEPPEPPVAPEEPPPVRVLAYRGFMETATGQTVAFMTVTDPRAKRTSLQQLVVGQTIDGIEIRDFNPEVLEVVGPKGNTQRIPKGGRRRIELE